MELLAASLSLDVSSRKFCLSSALLVKRESCGQRGQKREPCSYSTVSTGNDIQPSVVDMASGASPGKASPS